MSKEDDVKQMVNFVRDNFGKLDYAFNNAGTAYRWQAIYLSGLLVHSLEFAAFNIAW